MCTCEFISNCETQKISSLYLVINLKFYFYTAPQLLTIKLKGFLDKSVFSILQVLFIPCALPYCI